MLRPSSDPLRPLPGVGRSLLLTVALLTACSPGGDDLGDISEPAEDDPVTRPMALECAPDDDGLTLPDGFCAVVASEGIGPARHIEVRDDGDVFVARPDRRGGERGGVTALRDTTGDGRFDVEERWGDMGGNEVLLDGDRLYFAPPDRILRYHVPAGTLTPSGEPETLVSGLPADRNHTAKSVALGSDGALYVNIGAPSNACQQQPRTAGSAGLDPCPQLEQRAGIWRFGAEGTGRTQADGRRFATGLRNVVALTTQPGTGQVYGVQHGRDQLHDLFPDLYTVEENAALPSEELVAIDDGDDFGWPYCYHDWQQGRKLLAPEYGGDGSTVGRCADAEDPLVAFPGHWAPNDLAFYTGGQFPERYQGGAFIAFHGSWNRAPLPQEGYNVVFVPFDGGRPTGEWEVFADGFRSEGGERESARPVGVATAPDGSLYVVDSQRGRIWRIVYEGS
ncbi:MAG: PQQ-dependent sugar dehydrogenase [Gemmatimonadota bacterium]|jgi:glucose/arabinose dehydrogenase